MVGERDVPQPHRYRTGAGYRRASLALEGYIEEHAHLVHRREQVVEGFEVLAEPREPIEQRGDDELRGDELTERELPLRHEPPAEPQQEPARERLDRERAHDLPEEHAEVSRSGVEIVDRGVVGTAHRQLRSSGSSERERGADELLEPREHRVLRMTLGHTRWDRSAAEPDRDEEDHRDQQHVEREQVRVIERDQDHADPGLKHQRRAMEQEERNALLDRDHVEEAIDELGGGTLDVAREPRAR